MPEAIEPIMQVMSPDDGKIAAMIAIILAAAILSVWCQIEFADMLRVLPEKQIITEPVVEELGHARKITYFYTDKTGMAIEIPTLGSRTAISQEAFTWAYVHGRITRVDPPTVASK